MGCVGVLDRDAAGDSDLTRSFREVRRKLLDSVALVEPSDADARWIRPGKVVSRALIFWSR